MTYIEVDLRHMQSVDIGNNIRVIIMNIEGERRCRIGIEAPQCIRILRSELVCGSHQGSETVMYGGDVQSVSSKR